MHSCKICNKKLNPRSLGNHLFKSQDHNISIEEYYYKYLRKNKQEGHCLYCGKKTFYINYKKGYYKCCSLSCSRKNLKGKYKNTGKRNPKKYYIDKLVNSKHLNTYLDVEDIKKQIKEFDGSITRTLRIKTYCLKHDIYSESNFRNLISGAGCKKCGKEKEFETGVESGRFVPREQWSELKKYRRKVINLTYYTKRKKYSKEVLESCGKCGQKGSNQVDHCISVIHGFLYGIPPKEIASEKNLQILTWEENDRKKGNSWSKLDLIHFP